ncbi:MAG: hypothetical protein DSO03_01720 [Hadesarchaea archaeon]|nr:MAG: hypothetical protein DSO03_01720 [Hadesarchaea archaeon]
MAVFPHWVPLYKILQVVFATLCLLLTLKIADLLEIKRTPLILFPLILAYSFSWVSLTPHPDMLAMLFMLISLYFLLRYLREGKSVDGLMAVLSGFYGAMIREFALVTIFFAIFYFWCRYRKTSAYILSVFHNFTYGAGILLGQLLSQGSEYLLSFLREGRSSSLGMVHESRVPLERYETRAPPSFGRSLEGVFPLFPHVFLRQT